jgi:hypothetical protein
VCKQPSPREGLVHTDIRGVYFLPLLGSIHSPTFNSLPILLISFLVLEVHLMTFVLC